MIPQSTCSWLDLLASLLNRQARPVEDASQRNSEVEESWDSPSEEEEALYGTSPPYTHRQMKRMSGKHLRNSQMKSTGRSPIKGPLYFSFKKCSFTL